MLLVACFLLWRWVFRSEWSPAVSTCVILGGMALVIPVVRLGRRSLDRRPTPQHARRVLPPVHLSLLVLMGSSLLRAVATADSWRLWTIPIPTPIGRALLITTGVASLLSIVNLAASGLGAPLAVKLSRRLASDWLYRRSRNPMVLSTLACIASYGIWIQSLGFLLWTLFVAAPAWLAFLRVFEERELEIRFGQDYLDYRARTPRFFGRTANRAGR